MAFSGWKRKTRKQRTTNQRENTWDKHIVLWGQKARAVNQD